MSSTAKPPGAMSDHRKASVGCIGNGNPMPRLTRSLSLTTSTLPSNSFLPPELENQWRKRRESLERLQLDKVAPWMHLYDFSEAEAASGEGSSANSP